MSKCSECKRKIPEELLSPMITSSGNQADVCGVCALEISNQVLGIKRTRFNGEMAEDLRQDAIVHYKKTNQWKNK